MNFKDFLKLAARTDLDSYNHAGNRVVFHLGALHAVIGLQTEVGEVADAYKKHWFYGEPLDINNVREEIGDVMWYLASLCRHAEISFEECLQENITKLQARYPEGFSPE